MGFRIQVQPYRQRPDECGPASLKIALLALGIDADIDDLAQKSDYRPSIGTEHEGMIAAAESLGMHVLAREQGTIVDLEYFINELHLPVIVGWFDRDGDHYSVAVEITDIEVVLADPSSDGPERRFTRDEFPTIWYDFLEEGNQKISRGWMMVISPNPIIASNV